MEIKKLFNRKINHAKEKMDKSAYTKGYIDALVLMGIDLGFYPEKQKGNRKIKTIKKRIKTVKEIISEIREDKEAMKELNIWMKSLNPSPKKTKPTKEEMECINNINKQIREASQTSEKEKIE